VTSSPTRVLVFAPYLEEVGRLVSPHYDPPEYRSEIGSWLEALGMDWEWVPITARTLDAEIARARALATADHSVLVFNLCDGTVSDRFPGIEVVIALDASAVPYTGAGEDFYRVTTSKAASKSRLKAAGVPTSPWVLARSEDDVTRAAETIPFPLFVKPDVSAGSFGIQIDSVARDMAEARRQFNAVRAGLHGQTFEDDAVLIERFIEGREFTVLVVEDPHEPLGLFALAPGERVFDTRVPPSERFLAYERYWSLPEEDRPIPAGDPYYWYALAPAELGPALADLARRAFRAVDGTGYARVDIRQDEGSGELMVLEVNAQCGLSTSDSSTVGSLLNLCGQSMPPIIERVLTHGMGRFRHACRNVARPGFQGRGRALEAQRALRNTANPFVPVFIAYAEENGCLTNPEFEDPAVRAEIDGWMRALGCEWEWVTIAHSTLAAEIDRVRELGQSRPTVVLNLCDGDDVNGYPGLSVVKALENSGVSFTGARSSFYEISTSKRVMKQRFDDRGVRTPPFVQIRDANDDIGRAGDVLGWPLFVKPDVSAGSSGITASSLARNPDEGRRAVREAFANLHGYESWAGGLIAEPFLAGREFTVLLVGDTSAPEGLRAFTPVERVFRAAIPADARFLTCDRVMAEGTEDEAYSYAPASPDRHDELIDLARRAVLAVDGSGYARVDIRDDADPGVPYVLEVNANCGIAADPTSAVGSILHYSGETMEAFIDTIVTDAWRKMSHS